LSQEKQEWNNGAFTKAIVEGMRGAAARSDLPAISISDLQGYVSRRVRELTDRQAESGDGDADHGRRLLDRPTPELKDGPLRPRQTLRSSPGP
jgi:hypothetical protein